MIDGETMAKPGPSTYQAPYRTWPWGHWAGGKDLSCTPIVASCLFDALSPLGPTGPRVVSGILWSVADYLFIYFIFRNEIPEIIHVKIVQKCSKILYFRGFPFSHKLCFPP